MGRVLDRKLLRHVSFIYWIDLKINKIEKIVSSIMEMSSKRGLEFSLRAFASCCFLQLDMCPDIFLLEFFLDRCWKWLTTLTTSTVWPFYMLFPYLPLLWARRLRVPNFCLLSSMHQKTGKGFSLCLSHNPNST